MDPQKNEILDIKILWIHKKMKYLKSKFYGSTKKTLYMNQNFVDPQNVGNSNDGTFLSHRFITRVHFPKFTDDL
jgi:hypothetical protein